MADWRCIVLLLALAGCAAVPQGLSQEDRSRIEGRAIVVAETDPVTARRAAASVSNPTPWTAPLVGAAVSVLGELNESGRTRVGAVPRPERDPTPKTRALVVDYMVRDLGGIRSGRPFDARGIDEPNSRAQAAALFARAQEQGFPGVILDLQTTSFRVRSAGVGTGLRTERFYLDYDAWLVAVDAADGAVIANRGCSANSRAAAFTLQELEAGGPAILERASDLVAQQCAAALIQGGLLPRE